MLFILFIELNLLFGGHGRLRGEPTKYIKIYWTKHVVYSHCGGFTKSKREWQVNKQPITVEKLVDSLKFYVTVLHGMKDVRQS
jgi:hypothetical protein